MTAKMDPTDPAERARCLFLAYMFIETGAPASVGLQWARIGLPSELAQLFVAHATKHLRPARIKQKQNHR